MKETIDTFGGSLFFICFLVLIFLAQVFLIRWVLKINHMVFYLEKINDKLRRLCEEKALMTKTEIEK